MPANITNWPWPKVFSTPYRILGVSDLTPAEQLFIFESHYDGVDWSYFPVSIVEQPMEKPIISTADFGPFYVISLYDSEAAIPYATYVRDIEETEEFHCLIEQTKPAFGTCCAHKGQLVGGNVYSPSEDADNYWAELGSNAIVWSGIGRFEFDPTVDITAGYMQLLPSSTSTELPIVHRVFSLGDNVVAYTNSGNVILTPRLVGQAVTFGTRRMPGLGISSGNYVAGDDTIHGFIDLSNDFWTLDVSNKLTKRGYREWITELIGEGEHLEMSYVADLNRFYISSSSQCLVITETGAYHSHQCPSSVIKTFDGVLHANYMDTGIVRADAVLDSMDFGSRGLKSVESVTCDIDLDSGASATFAVDYRYDKSEDFVRSSYRSGGPTGEASILITALDFRLCIRASSYLNCEINSIMANIKYSDQRFKRGTVPAQLNTARRFS